MIPTTQIPGYHIVRKLGQGGMATVYLATQLEPRRQVALKLMHPHLSSELSHRKRFAAEAVALAQLDHPNIVRILESGSVDSTLFMAMQYVEGGKTLREALPLKGSTTQILHLLRQIASGLAHAHSRGIVHRDIKPSNILLDSNNQPLIADFGIVKILEAEFTNVTQTGVAVGTPKYMSPEQALGIDTDARSDLYSFGIIFYQLLTGQQPYRSSFEHLHAPTPTLPPQLAAYQAVINQLLAKDPDERLPSAEILIKLLNDLAELSIDISLPIPPAAPAKYSSHSGRSFKAVAFFFNRNKTTEISPAQDQLNDDKPRSLESSTESRPWQQLNDLVKVIRQWWGPRLPARRFKLDFNLPVSGQRMQFEMQPDKLRKILEKSSRNDPINLINKMENYLRSLSHHKVSVVRRQVLLQVVTEALFPKVIYIKEAFQRDGCIPESESRSQHLDAAIRFVKILIVNHQLIFQHDYNLSSWKYRFARTRLRAVAFRIIELCSIQQQLHALRYQPLEENGWRICNTIFWIMLSYERVDKPYNLLTVQGSRFKVQATLLQLFSEIHLTAIWRHLGWPTQYLPVITVYLRQAIEPVKLNLYEKDFSDSDLLYIDPFQGRAAQFIHPRGEYPPLALDINRLRRRIQQDLTQLGDGECFKSPNSSVPLPLRRINPADRHWLLNSMMTNLNRDPSEILADPLASSHLRWHLFIGLERILNFLSLVGDYSGAVWNCENRPNVDLEISLAQRSAPLNPDIDVDNFWYHLGSDDREVAFQTLETPFTFSVVIGAPIIFFPEGDPQQITLGFVSLIQRIEESQFIIAITRHGNQLRLVRISPLIDNDKSTNEEFSFLGLLIDHGKDKPKDIFIPANSALATGDVVTISYSQRRVPKLLGTRRSMGGENHLYTLESYKARMASRQFVGGRVTQS
ncbi:MAG: serine/threonine protein kinase [Candidatus Competibacterales bacterium]